VLLDTNHYLKVTEEFNRELTTESARNLASGAGTSHRFYEFFHYISGCLRMLKDTGVVDGVFLYLGSYDLNDYSSEGNDIIEAINHTALEILKHTSKMKIQELQFLPGQSTAHIADIMPIIERNVKIRTSPVADWSPRLPHFPKLKKTRCGTL
jgi:hypothetical protein